MKTRTLFFCLFLAASVLHGESTNALPTFQEIFRVVSTNLGVITSDRLDRAAAQGLLDELAPQVSLASQSKASGLAPLAQTRMFDKGFAYFRVGSVNSKLPGAFRSMYRTMMDTNGGKIRGIVLDLRFAGGTDYAAAAKTADCFLDSDEPLLDWREGSAKATKKTDAILVPVAILINSDTTGAAEALAAVLRETGVGLILGGPTAGGARVFREFPLSDGDKLRVAVGNVSVGEGKPLTGGVAPDIAVESNLQDEKAYLQDPYKDLHAAPLAQADSSTNPPVAARPRFNEKELVREHSAGEDTDEGGDEVGAGPAEPEPPVVADPVLARALDLLKGLAVIQPNRPG
ncbi:MAG TPA: S41 family peptidase [Verrucomicrobiae bacterium]|nr:S41 family peptidase [Verrucomicrobiae bacterium]